MKRDGESHSQLWFDGMKEEHQLFADDTRAGLTCESTATRTSRTIKRPRS